VRAINSEAILASTATEERQGSLYHSLGASGSLFERVILPGTAGTGGAPRFVHFMATAFPTTEAAQAAWRGDTSFLGSYLAWIIHERHRPQHAAVERSQEVAHIGHKQPDRFFRLEGCARRDLVTVQGRYSAYACQMSTGNKQSYIAVTAVRGNVEFAFYVIVYNDHPASLSQLQADASTLTRHAFAIYAHLPVRHGAVREVAPGQSPVPPAPTATPRPTATPTPPTATPMPPTATPMPPTATPTPAPRQVSATIQTDAFSPNPITVARGTTVTWTNLDGVPHTITADDGSWGSGTLGQGDTYSHVFTSPGTYTYHCAIHPFMMGTVVVTP
jgi:plastocyanin